MDQQDVTALPASELAAWIAAGRLRAEEAVEAHLERIAATEERVQAWVHLDAELALAQARACDRTRGSGRALGPLHGVPVGVKDIIDTADLPTENGTVLDAGRRPERDAAVVTRLREAGAVVLGKTVTTELAVYHPGKTRNPHHPGHTPGGSSSGSAAAVAANMVPLAIGTQTNGSVIRPASYCGIFGFKPSRGLISRRGVLTQSPTLDTVGTMARSLEDAALLADVLAGYDDADRAMRPAAPPRLLEGCRSEPPLRPLLALVRTPWWERTEPDLQAGFAELAEALGEEAIDEVELPRPFDRALDLHRTIMVADLAKNFARYYERGRDRLSDALKGMIEEGRGVLAVDYSIAQDWIEVLNAGLEEIFERYDAIVTPATTGEAPSGLESTGSPMFCTLWTTCGVPAVTLPLLTGANGLPIGVQLVGRRGNDARLLRTARWLLGALQGESAGRDPASEA